MDDDLSSVEIHEAGDQDSADAISKFLTMLVERPNVQWTLAYVHRQSGLTLYDRFRKEGLHFRNAICGFSGTGPQASAKILARARFGPEPSLRAMLERKDTLVFRR